MDELNIDANANFEDIVKDYLLLDDEQFLAAGAALELLCDAYMEASKWDRFTKTEH